MMRYKFVTWAGLQGDQEKPRI